MLNTNYGCVASVKAVAMANKEQLAILELGVEEWNEWRQDHPHQPINLIHAS